jgi:hypothetical protein
MSSKKNEKEEEEEEGEEDEEGEDENDVKVGSSESVWYSTLGGQDSTNVNQHPPVVESSMCLYLQYLQHSLLQTVSRMNDPPRFIVVHAV